MSLTAIDEDAALGVEPGLDPDPLTEEPSGQISLQVGGKRPTSTSLRVVGGAVDVEQEFAKGQTVVIRMEAEITEVAFVDQRDQRTGQVVGCERRHKARPVEVSVERVD